jgi:hypothetical protein
MRSTSTNVRGQIGIRPHVAALDRLRSSAFTRARREDDGDPDLYGLHALLQLHYESETTASACGTRGLTRIASVAQLLGAARRGGQGP